MPDPATSPPAPEEQMHLFARPGYLPLILFTAWWNAVFDMLCPPCPHHAHSRHHDLPVPPPVEDTGEHALFA